MTKIKRQIISIFLAWLIFIGVDFIFHASLFASYWNEGLSGLKSLDDLAMLIPAGYLSFFLFTCLIGYVFFNIFKIKPELLQVLKFGFIFALLFSLSNLFGLFSYVNLPLKQLIIFNLVYFIEVIIVWLILNYIAFSVTLKKSILFLLLIFFIPIIEGIVIQNLFLNI